MPNGAFGSFPSRFVGLVLQLGEGLLRFARLGIDGTGLVERNAELRQGARRELGLFIDARLIVVGDRALGVERRQQLTQNGITRTSHRANSAQVSVRGRVESALTATRPTRLPISLSN